MYLDLYPSSISRYMDEVRAGAIRLSVGHFQASTSHVLGGRHGILPCQRVKTVGKVLPDKEL